MASRVLFECQFPEITKNSKNHSPRKRQKIDNHPVDSLHGLWVAYWGISPPIREGEHTLMLESGIKTEKDSKPPPKKMASWQTFDQNLEGLPPFGVSQEPHVCFNLSWTEAISHLRSDLKRSFLPSACKDATRVHYQLYYMSKSRVCTQTYDQPLCQFCEIKPDPVDASRYGKPVTRTRVFKSVKDLMCHLKNCHDKFVFRSPEERAIKEGQELETVFIEVYPNPKYVRSYLGNSKNTLESLRKGETKVLVWRGVHVDPDETYNKEYEFTDCSLTSFGHTRLYFHTSYNLPIRACEFEYDSEDDQSHEFNWVRSHMVKQIDEFTDVNEDEKLIMKLWNHQLMVTRVLSQQQLLEACRTISRKYGKFIYKRNVRRNWLLHLLNLVDHCLLKASEVPKIMVLMDECVKDESIPYEEPDITGDKAHEENLKKIIEDSAKRNCHFSKKTDA
ncbi:Oidioi.mRNA.OKI2018_I69.chr1.g3341.t1.cds [Oikopleura dioica]|uniref:Oidioi.mRNA.OKI2018_I69.chr1.g3341.t1.cds n=1 Tax=Oikopleura dioica TaxID=34765 RepID=A0ABN7SXP8_OIKDI|nr:Oidioi.mRNA.OKI2018_I69.chr1.g3341.t1.cds [Oikopleura dioica]